MQYIILIGNEELTLDSIKAINHHGCIDSYDVSEIKGRYCVDYGEDHIFYDYNNSIVNDYDDIELKKLPFKKPHFIMMVYKSEERMISVLSQDSFLKGIYVDNDYGLVVPIEEFIKMGMPVSTWGQQ